MTKKSKVKIEREDEKYVKISFSTNICGDGFWGSAVVVDGKLTKLELRPSDYQFRKWFKTKARLSLLRRFLKAVEKEILYIEEKENEN